MIILDTEKKLNCVIEGLENGDIILDNRVRTEEEWEEIRREVEECKAQYQKKQVEKPVLV
jgi:hypothetical protein